MSEFFQILIQSNTINFLIVLALIVYLIKKLNVNQKIEEIKCEVENYVNDSDKEKVSAERALENIEVEIKKLPEITEEIKKSADKSIKGIDEKLQRDIKNQKTDIQNNAERILQLEIKKFKSGLSNVLSEKSVEIAQKNAQKQLQENSNLHNVYIDNAIEEIDRILSWKSEILKI